MTVTGWTQPNGRDLGDFVVERADALFRTMRNPARSLVDIVLDEFDWVQLIFRPLGAFTGRQDALTAPRRNGGFLIALDPELAPSDTRAGRSTDEALDLRLAHEIGHTIFYSPGAPPVRWRQWRPQEESYADEFGSQLLKLLAGTRRQVRQVA